MLGRGPASYPGRAGVCGILQAPTMSVSRSSHQTAHLIVRTCACSIAPPIIIPCIALTPPDRRHDPNACRHAALFSKDPYALSRHTKSADTIIFLSHLLLLSFTLCRSQVPTTRYTRASWSSLADWPLSAPCVFLQTMCHLCLFWYFDAHHKLFQLIANMDIRF
jgi:hypothetical protein